MKLNKKQKKTLAIGISVFVILIGFVFLSQFFDNTLSISGTGTFTPVLCNDYEFTCCSEVLKYNQPSFKLSGINVLQCPSTATKCIIKKLSGTSTFYVGENCHYVNALLGWACDSRTVRQTSVFTIYPNQYVMTAILESATIEVETYAQKLLFCGRSGCTQGVEVSGSDGCKFNPSNGVIYTSTSSLTGKISTSSYTVPSGSCVLAFQSGDRHICGYKEESCSSNSDCGGHTYGNVECNARTKQTYGCKNYGTTIIGGDRSPFDSGWGENSQQSPLNTFGKRCEIISAQQVQCCGDTDCGTNYRCDTSTFTCKPSELVECDENSDCGVSTQCDWTTKQLKEPVCISNKCGFKTESVGCCLDANCPLGYFCSADKKCEKSIAGLQACPFQCCVSDSRYVDKLCPTDKPYCIDGSCSTTPSGSGTGAGGGTCESCDAFTKSQLLGWVFPSQKCNKALLQNNLFCALSYFKLIAVLVVFIFSLLFGKDLLSSFNALKDKGGLAWIISSVIAVSLAVLTYFIFLAGVIVAVIIIVARVGIKMFLKR